MEKQIPRECALSQFLTSFCMKAIASVFWEGTCLWNCLLGHSFPMWRKMTVNLDPYRFKILFQVTCGPLVSSCTYFCVATLRFQGVAAQYAVGTKGNHVTHVRSSFSTRFKMDSLNSPTPNGREYLLQPKILFVSCLLRTLDGGFLRRWFSLIPGSKLAVPPAHS